MSESINTAPTGGINYRCTRGCGDVLGGPQDQDQHNQTRHGNSGWNRPGESAPTSGSQSAEAPPMTRDEAVQANQEAAERLAGGSKASAAKKQKRAPVKTRSDGSWPQ